MKNALKGYIIGVISTILVIGCITAFAANTTTLRDVIANGVKSFVEGKKSIRSMQTAKRLNLLFIMVPHIFP